MHKFVIGVASGLLTLAGSAQAAAPEWRLSEVSGDVRITLNGKAQRAARGALLSSGSTIATAAGARAVAVRGEEFVVISPRTQLRLPPPESVNPIVQWIEDFGTAVFKVKKKTTPHFGVQTPYLAAVVKGTTFSVSVTAEGASVQVTEGAVEVGTLDGGARDLVAAGTIALVAASDVYQLTLQGDQQRIIRSPNAPAAGPQPQSRSEVSQPSTADAAAPLAAEIVAPIAEQEVSLAELTDGLIQGSTVANVAMAEIIEQGRQLARNEAAPPPQPVAEPVAGPTPSDPAPPTDPEASPPISTPPSSVPEGSNADESGDRPSSELPRSPEAPIATPEPEVQLPAPEPDVSEAPSIPESPVETPGPAPQPDLPALAPEPEPAPQPEPSVPAAPQPEPVPQPDVEAPRADPDVDDHGGRDNDDDDDHDRGDRDDDDDDRDDRDNDEDDDRGDRDDDDDGNNGHGNDRDGRDDSNPGRGSGGSAGRGSSLIPPILEVLDRLDDRLSRQGGGRGRGRFNRNDD